MDRKAEPARVLGVLFIAGATVAVISLALPHPPLHMGLLIAITATAYLTGAAVYRFAGRVSERMTNAIVFVATAEIGAAIYASGFAGGIYGSLFFWVALFAGLFCSRRMAMVQVAWAMVVYGVLVARVDNPSGFSPVTRWLLTGITIGVVAAVTNWIAEDRNRIDRERQDLLTVADTMAHTDVLTGLPNRRAWDETIAAALDRAILAGSGLCVAVIDVDNLKLVNDRDGHEAGDRMLQEAAERWRDVLREGDYIARYGGDEFALLLSDCAIDQAESIVERLRRTAPPGHSYSAGAAAWDGTESASELLHRADGSLYTAKAGGRNRLALATV